MKIVTMPLTDLVKRANPRNAKSHDIESLIQSFKRFGFAAPPTIDEESGTLVAGHGRIDALKQMRNGGEPPPSGITEKGTEWLVPVMRGIRFKNKQEREAYTIADNQLTMSGGWRFDALTDLLAELREAENGLDGLGFRDDEIASLFGQVSEDGKQIEVNAHMRQLSSLKDSPIPETPKVPVTKRGDIWLLGDHRLLCGDCRDSDEVAGLMAGAAANIALTSPPYASQRDYDPSSGFEPVPPDRYLEWFANVQKIIAHHLAADGSWFLNIKPHADEGQRSLYVMELVLEHVRQWGWLFVDEFCWRNTRNGVPGGWPNRFKNAWEPVYHFSRQRSIKMRPDAVSEPSPNAFEYSSDHETSPGGSGIMLLGSSVDTHEGFARPSNVIEAASETSQSNHAAPFPLALPAFFIAAFTDANDVVLEPFAGSGTTLIAAEQLKRRCCAIEISPNYCDVIVERWQKLTGEQAHRA